ncbi:MAG: class I SAM-dependent methyltransferase [Phycisphaerales bacterium]|nr:class I SAM-dependent methyltransferase [Phycisphaerales bacterium]
MQWFEDDHLWRELREVLFTPETLAKAPAEIDALWRLVGPRAGAAVLDLPCGVGRHAIELARRGCRVTAADRTRPYLLEARDAASAVGVELELVEADMREFCRPGAFDFVFNLWTSFGYNADPADDARVLANFFASLKPGGTLVMELHSKETCAKVFRERDWRRLPDGRVLIEERAVRDGWGWIDNVWNVLDGPSRREIRFGHRLYSAIELCDLASRAGFTDVRTFNGLTGLPFDHGAERLAITARRD